MMFIQICILGQQTTTTTTKSVFRMLFQRPSESSPSKLSIYCILNTFHLLKLFFTNFYKYGFTVACWLHHREPIFECKKLYWRVGGRLSNHQIVQSLKLDYRWVLKGLWSLQLADHLWKTSHQHLAKFFGCLQFEIKRKVTHTTSF